MAIHWLIPEDGYVVKGCTRSCQNACFLWCHSNFRMEKMESPLPPPKCLFDNHTGLCVGSIEGFLLGSGWWMALGMVSRGRDDMGSHCFPRANHPLVFEVGFAAAVQ